MRVAQHSEIARLQSACHAICLIYALVADLFTALRALFLFDRIPSYAKSDYEMLGKRPKWIATDAALMANLLNWNEDDVYLVRGALFETMVVDEFLKRRANVAGHWNINYYRDSNRNEIDLVIDHAGVVDLCEVKSGETFSSDWANTMVRLSAQFGSDVSRTVIYGGDESQSRSEFELKSWREF